MVLAWTGFAAATVAGLTATVRFLFPNVLFEPPTRFKAGDPSTYSPGVDERWKEKFGVWIVRDTNSIYALVAVCVHLGCTPNWLQAQNKFKCPCHGSGYYVSGINFEGPAPRPLERAEITLSPEDGQIIVDKATRYLYERGQWSDAKGLHQDGLGPVSRHPEKRRAEVRIWVLVGVSYSRRSSRASSGNRSSASASPTRTASAFWRCSATSSCTCTRSRPASPASRCATRGAPAA